MTQNNPRYDNAGNEVSRVRTSRRLQVNPAPLGVTRVWRVFVRDADLYANQIGTVRAIGEEQAIRRAQATWPDAEYVLPTRSEDAP